MTMGVGFGPLGRFRVLGVLGLVGVWGGGFERVVGLRKWFGSLARLLHFA